MPDQTLSDREPGTTDTEGDHPGDQHGGPTGSDLSANPADRSVTLRRWAFLGVLVLLLVAVVALAIRFFDTGSGDPSLAKAGDVLIGKDSASSHLSERRDAATQAAEEFVVTQNTYGPDMLDKHGKLTSYRKAMDELMTPKFAKSFEDTGVKLAEAVVSQGKISRSVRIYATGVAGITDETADVLVVGQITHRAPVSAKSEKTRVVDRQPIRTRVSLQFDDGKWLVDDVQAASKSPDPTKSLPQGGN